MQIITMLVTKLLLAIFSLTFCNAGQLDERQGYDDEERHLSYYHGGGGGGGYYGGGFYNPHYYYGYGPFPQSYYYNFPYYPYSYYPPYYPPPPPPYWWWSPSPSPLPNPTCQYPKRYEGCGSACPSTCADPYPQVCTYNCVAGCFCPPHLVLDENTDTCVPLAQCPTVPGPVCSEPGTEYDAIVGTCVAVSCEASNACPDGQRCTPAVLQCIRAPCPQFTCAPYGPPPTQECTGGKYLGDECSPIPVCDLTCTSPDPTPCPAVCGPPRCLCPAGTVLDEVSDTCVNPIDCPY